jgi:uncharacterized membrane protein
VKYLLEVLKESSIHGVNQIISKHQSTIGKVLWIAIVLTSTITCGSLIANYVKNMQLNPVAFEIDEKLWSVEEVSCQSCQARCLVKALKFLRSNFLRFHSALTWMLAKQSSIETASLMIENAVASQRNPCETHGFSSFDYN